MRFGAKYIHLPILFFLVFDVSSLALAITLGLSIRHSESLRIIWSDNLFILQIVSFVVAGCLSQFMLGAYRWSVISDNGKHFAVIVYSTIMLFFVCVAIFYTFQTPRIWIGALGLALIMSVLFISIMRYVFCKFIMLKVPKRRTLALGTGANASKLEALLKLQPIPMIEFQGFIRLGDEIPAIENDNILICPTELSRFARDKRTDQIVVALDDASNCLPTTELLKCRMAGISVVSISEFLEEQFGYIDLETVDMSQMMFMSGFNAWARLDMSIKRVIDIVLSSLILVYSAPLLAVCAIAIRIESPGASIYKQQRVGFGGRRFSLFKLRTMFIEAEVDGVPQWSRANDDRVTRVGALLRRCKIDEIPQCLNVLYGDMSIIGPRPERPEFVEALKPEIPHFDLRHTVKPGISGWAQINFPYASNFEQSRRKFEYDLYYIKNHSFLLDIIIILQTIHVIIWPEESPQAERMLKSCGYAPRGK